ncbi:XRE family transcriptional regulator [Mycobacterium sp. M23085]|uniref:XRE family transcriptional regulator n=1 Tax=Mycobacterium sp. M23085 TaxID=3378087 RepID=UPI0038781345
MPRVEQSAKEWQKSLSHRVGVAVRERRHTLKVSAADLARRTTELGYPISRVAIGKIENGHREGKMDLAELLVLAAALAIPPVMLIYPALPHGSVEVLPGLEVDSVDALEWFVGDSPKLAFRMTERFGTTQQQVVDVGESLVLARELKGIEAELARVRGLQQQLDSDEKAKAADGLDGGRFAQTLKSAIDANERSRRHTIRLMQSLGLPVREEDL